MVFGMCRGVFLNHGARLTYHPNYQIELVITYGGGSLLYVAGALLSWIKVTCCLPGIYVLSSEPRCWAQKQSALREPVALH